MKGVNGNKVGVIGWVKKTLVFVWYWWIVFVVL
jgi:hypothetical protein